MIRLFHRDALEFLKDCDDYNTIFMDLPDNLGADYGVKDNYPLYQYIHWVKQIIDAAIMKGKVIWISYYWKYDIQIKKMIPGYLRARTFIWRFTFGQYTVSDCASGYRPILRLGTMKWNTNDIRVPSRRMELEDPRAAGPRVPDDVWEFPRIVGNSKERRTWAPNQHPEALVERIFKMSPGPILELFSGSGTGIRVAKKWGIDLDTVELSSEMISRLRAEHSFLGLCGFHLLEDNN